MGIAKKDWCGKALAVWCSPEDLAAVWPDMYEVLLENIEKIPHVKDGRGGYRPRKNKPNKQDVSNQTRVKSDTTDKPTEEPCADCVAGRKCYSHYEYG